MAHSSLTSFAVFQSTILKEVIRSLHVYGSMEIEREFLFERKSCYVEEERVKPYLLLLPKGVFRRPEEISIGSVFGIWRCIFLFRFNQPLPRFPTLLCLSRNAKLEDIPNLANDLKFIAELKQKKVSKVSDQKKCSRIRHCNFDQPKPLNLISKVDRVRECEVDQPKPRKIVFKQDLNFLPDSETEAEESENDQTEHSESDAKSTETMKKKKKKRTQSEHVAGLSLEDLSKYFGVPIVEASRRLHIGLTVLKKKCREFGIPRWPHRKIKSLDTLINDLQGEAEKQKNEAAAVAVAKRQKKLETEKRNIVKRPFMEMQIETKKFRQDNFKKRHKASRAKKNQESLVTSSSTFKVLDLLTETSNILG